MALRGGLAARELALPVGAELVRRQAGAGGAGLALLAAHEGVAAEALRADAVVAAGEVLAEGVDAADAPLPAQALVHVGALARAGVAVVPSPADALPGHARLGLVF